MDHANQLTDVIQHQLESLSQRIFARQAGEPQHSRPQADAPPRHSASSPPSTQNLNSSQHQNYQTPTAINKNKLKSMTTTATTTSEMCQPKSTTTRLNKLMDKCRSYRRSRSDFSGWNLVAPTLCALLIVSASAGFLQSNADEQANSSKASATQASIDRQVSSPQNAASIQAASASSSPASVAVSSPASSNSKSPASNVIDSKSSTPPKQSQKNHHHQASGHSKDKAASSKLAAQQQNYDKYQLKASPFSHHQNAAHAAANEASQKASAAAAASPQASSAAASPAAVSSDSSQADSASKHDKYASTSSSSGSFDEPSKGSSSQVAQKKSSLANKGKLSAQPSSSSFSILKRILPSFMTSATAAAAVAAVASNNPKQSSPNSRSSISSSGASDIGGSSPLATNNIGASPLMGKISNKLIDYLASHSKKSLANPVMMDKSGSGSASGNLFTLLRNRSPIGQASAGGIHDRQAGPTSGLASLLSNPLGLGLLFSAPLIPSLLLTPLALAGLSPAMSAINNLFNDDDDETPALGANGKPVNGQTATPVVSSPFASLLSSPSSPLSTFLQNTGIGTASGDASSSSGERPSFALQAVQSFLGPTSTTERPLFNPGMFASGSARVQNAISNALSGAAGSSGQSSSSSTGASSSNPAAAASSPIGSILNPNGSPIRSFFTGGGSGGGSLMQAAASMISPSFAAAPSSGSATGAAAAAAADDDKSILQMASDVFEKVSNFMDTDKSDVAQASGPASSSGSNMQSPIQQLVGLSSFSPFQLSSLLSSSPFGSALIQPAGLSQSGSGSSSSSSAAGQAATSAAGSAGLAPIKQQRAGFFGTLKNIYELFSSSFLRRQEVGSPLDASNECQQRLICELHQKAMNSKLFRRSVQSNLMELAQLDRNLQDQLKLQSLSAPGSLSARVDPETKAMLSDFLKATNGFKQGRELVSCSKMFPKCSRSMLFSFANTHLGGPSGLMSVASLGDSTSSKALGKFSNLMKKMKFKSASQHQQQWKLRKPGKANSVPRVVPVGATMSSPLPPNSISQIQQVAPMSNIPMIPQVASTELAAQDYFQVAPLNLNQQTQASQLNPVDSLKIAQQILMYQQQQQQQQLQQQPNTFQQPQYQVASNQDMGQAESLYGPNNNYQAYIPSQQQPMAGQQLSYQQQSPQQINNNNINQKQQITYSDSIGQQQQQQQGVNNMYSTDSPFFGQNQPQQQQPQVEMQQQQQQPQPQQPSQQPTNQSTTVQQSQYSTRSGVVANQSQSHQMTTPVMSSALVGIKQTHNQPAIAA